MVMAMDRFERTFVILYVIISILYAAFIGYIVFTIGNFTDPICVIGKIALVICGILLLMAMIRMIMVLREYP